MTRFANRSTPARELRIVVVADPYIPVPPRHYGGIERIIAFLVNGLEGRGHSVTLLAHPASHMDCELMPYGSPPHVRTSDRIRELWQVSAGLVGRRRQFDLVHSFGRLAATLPALAAGIPVIQSYQRAITARNIAWARRLGGARIAFTACSTSCRARVSHLGRWKTVYNGVRLDDYTFQPTVGDEAPLVFLGRVERIKGAHTAIEIARRSGRRLVIAGNVPDEAQHQHYFEQEVKPHLDGGLITYIGPVDDIQKNELLGSAAAFLMPIEWEEPFGIVMAEALACGTPVIGTPRGSVPEVVEHGVSGFVCATVSEMAEAVGRIGDLDRSAARRRCEACFSSEVIVDAYERLYVDHIERNRS